MASFTTHYAIAATAQDSDFEPLFPSGPPVRWVSDPIDQPIYRAPDRGAGGGGAAGGGGVVDIAVEELKRHARAAVAIEFTTIPMYLYATWSIRSDNGGPGSKARYCILGKLLRV